MDFFYFLFLNFGEGWCGLSLSLSLSLSSICWKKMGGGIIYMMIMCVCLFDVSRISRHKPQFIIASIMQSLPLAFESLLFLKGTLFWGVGGGC